MKVGWAVVGAAVLLPLSLLALLSHSEPARFALARYRRLAPGALLKHVPIAAGLAILITAPYLSTLVGWAGGGGATAVVFPLPASGRGSGGGVME